MINIGKYFFFHQIANFEFLVTLVINCYKIEQLLLKKTGTNPLLDHLNSEMKNRCQPFSLNAYNGL